MSTIVQSVLLSKTTHSMKDAVLHAHRFKALKIEPGGRYWRLRLRLAGPLRRAGYRLRTKEVKPGVKLVVAAKGARRQNQGSTFSYVVAKHGWRAVGRHALHPGYPGHVVMLRADGTWKHTSAKHPGEKVGGSTLEHLDRHLGLFGKVEPRGNPGSHYQARIQKVTGATAQEAAEIEEMMRHDIFHSTLDWQPAPLFDKAARVAYAALRGRPLPRSGAKMLKG